MSHRPCLTPTSDFLSHSLGHTPVTFSSVSCHIPISHPPVTSSSAILLSHPCHISLSHLSATSPLSFTNSPSAVILLFSFCHISLRHFPVTFSSYTVTSSHYSPATVSLAVLPSFHNVCHFPVSRLLVSSPMSHFLVIFPITHLVTFFSAILPSPQTPCHFLSHLPVILPFNHPHTIFRPSSCHVPCSHPLP